MTRNNKFFKKMSSMFEILRFVPGMSKRHF